MVGLILLAYQVSDRGDCFSSYMVRVLDVAVFGPLANSRCGRMYIRVFRGLSSFFTIK
jgi:hypothetical protein